MSVALWSRPCCTYRAVKLKRPVKLISQTSTNLLAWANKRLMKLNSLSKRQPSFLRSSNHVKAPNSSRKTPKFSKVPSTTLNRLTLRSTLSLQSTCGNQHGRVHFLSTPKESRSSRKQPISLLVAPETIFHLLYHLKVTSYKPELQPSKGKRLHPQSTCVSSALTQ